MTTTGEVSGPKTRAEAEGWEYILLDNNPRVVGRYSHNLCAWALQANAWLGERQCARKPGYGPEGLWCKQHAKMAEEE